MIELNPLKKDTSIDGIYENTIELCKLIMRINYMIETDVIETPSNDVLGFIDWVSLYADETLRTTVKLKEVKQQAENGL